MKQKNPGLKYFLTIMSVLFLQSEMKAQNDSLFQILTALPNPVASFEVGALGELYIMDTDNQLKKLDEKGDSIGVFNQVTKSGKLSYVVAQNPWKTLLYYRDFSTIVIIDKFMNVTGNINLRAKGLHQVNAVTSSYDNHIWVFDAQESKLKKIDDNGNVLMESVDLRSMMQAAPAPAEILDHDGFVYLADPDKGLYIFDHYGSFKSRIPYSGWRNIAVMGKNVYGFDRAKMFTYQPPLPGIEEYLLPEKMQNSQIVKLAHQKLYVLKEGRLSIYTFTSTLK